MKTTNEATTFQLAGQICQLIPDKQGEGWKALDLRLETGLTYRIKLSQDLDASSYSRLRMGERVWVSGDCKPSKQGGMPKLKARGIHEGNSLDEGSAPLTAIAPLGSCRLQICTKGSCRKRGAKQLQVQVEDWLQEQGLANCVTIQETGCLKDCKKGPNVRILPIGKQLNRFRPEMLKILNQELAESLEGG